MKLKLYYAIEFEQKGDKDILTYHAGPFKSWTDAWDYIYGAESVNTKKNLFVAENELEVTL